MKIACWNFIESNAELELLIRENADAQALGQVAGARGRVKAVLRNQMTQMFRSMASGLKRRVSASSLHVLRLARRDSESTPRLTIGIGVKTIGIGVIGIGVRVDFLGQHGHAA